MDTDPSGTDPNSTTVDVTRWRPGVARSVRGPRALQLGVGASAHLLSNLSALDWQFLALLERGLQRTELLATGARAGLTPARCSELLTLLGRAEALDITGSDPCPRGSLSGAHVAVVGGGGLGVLLTVGLASAGATTSALVDDATIAADDVLPGGATRSDIGRRAAHVAAEAVHRLYPDTRTACPAHPDVVVLVSAHVPDAPAAIPLVQAGIRHLPVVVLPDVVQVGPLVLPGRGACLHCVDLHHCDLDPGWADAIQSMRRQTPRPAIPASAICAIASGLCTLLAGASAPESRAGVQVLVDTAGLTTWQRWRAHPACGCIGWPDPQDPVPPDERADATMAA